MEGNVGVVCAVVHEIGFVGIATAGNPEFEVGNGLFGYAVGRNKIADTFHLGDTADENDGGVLVFLWYLW